MLYKKNLSTTVSDELFKNPTAEYRGTPFWAWNTDLNQQELDRQIEIFNEMGLGGFHMHVRTGMSTKYLSDDFMALIKGCTEKAKELNMLSWLYDEDRWPSGSAGGIVTKDYQYRGRYLLFTSKKCDDEVDENKVFARSNGGRTSAGKLAACYDVTLDDEGCIKDYKLINESDEAKGKKWYAYVKINSNSSWYNNQAYVDTLSPKAMKKFLEVTHERYKEVMGDEFDKAIPAIFTDEPQFVRIENFKNPFEERDVCIPWTDDIPETYKAKYGCDIFETLPELFWELPNGKLPVARYYYHDHICDRFTEAFADQIGNWCKENNIALTGHMMEEPTLNSQTRALGEAMRSYRSFGIPGIDMLCARFEFTTAKQTQSAVHQYGQEAMLSELYGVTGWDYDFRGYKLHGDWQAALGVTVRVPHLSWVAMGGEAKRDYPASISYQSPWYKEWSYIENHFARVNTLMTRGKPVIKVGVIHPIESYWLHFGTESQTGDYRNQMDERFLSVTDWLLKGSIDFNFISESLFPAQCKEGTNPIKVGEMEYDAIVVPQCETLRATTIEILEQFRAKGGKLIFMGSAPTFCDGIESERGKALYDSSIVVPYERDAILSSLEENRVISIKNDKGELTDGFIYQLRNDNGSLNLFISRCKEPESKDEVKANNLVIGIKGEWAPVLYDTMSGDIYEVPCSYKNGNTYIEKTLYDYDSLLLKLNVGKSDATNKEEEKKECKSIEIPDEVDYELSDSNVLLIDMCEYALDEDDFSEREEILRLDNICREKAVLKERGGAVAQPWSVPKDIPQHSITLRYSFESEIEVADALLGIEKPEEVEITFNGEKVSDNIVGWYVDKDVKTLKLPAIKKGTNTLIVKVPLGDTTNTEWMYITGNFGVEVNGNISKLVAKPEKIKFGSVTTQCFPFYGGNITYKIPFEGEGKYNLTATKYVGALIGVCVDKERKGRIVFPPYSLEFEADKGNHTLEITLFGNRQNAFGPVHRTIPDGWIGPSAWRTKGEEWDYNYRLKNLGIMEKPIIK